MGGRWHCVVLVLLQCKVSQAGKGPCAVYNRKLGFLGSNLIAETSASGKYFASVSCDTWKLRICARAKSPNLGTVDCLFSLEIPQITKYAILVWPMGEFSLSRETWTFLSVVILNPFKYRLVRTLGLQKQN